MEQQHEERRLTTILVTDIVGYSRLMAADQAGTFAQLKALQKELIEPKVSEHHGRLVKLTGDGALMEFGSVTEAVLFALEVQHAMAERNAQVPGDRRVVLRIGINIGEIIVDQNDIYGDGVNVASRLQEIAEPGTVYISQYVYTQLKGKAPLRFEDLGTKRVKNIPEPVQVYRVENEPNAALAILKKASRPQRPRRWAVAAILLLTLLGLGAGLLWLRPLNPEIKPASIERMAYPLPEKPSIAVLPFSNISGESEQEYFADGMTDDLITDLSKVSGLFVIARNSVFTYEDKPVRVQEVAEELGVRYVLQGSVRRASGRVRINAQLTDATTGRHLWADRYDREFEDIFALQDEVTQQIVSALDAQLTEGEKEQLASRQTNDMQAYEFYQRGQKTVHSFSISYPEELNTALLMFEQAIERDPQFARAYVGHALVSYYVWRVAYVVPTRSVIEAREDALKSITTALALEPRLPEAYSVLAQILLADGRYDEAIAAAANAVKLDPNNADGYVAQALILTKAGQHEQALEAMSKAYRLNPKPPPHYDLYRGKVLFDNRNYAKAVESLEKGLRGQPRASLFLWYLAPAYAYLDRFEDARAAVSSIFGFVPHENLMRLGRVGLYELEDDTEHYVEGFRRAGLPELPFGYDTSGKEKLGVREARSLLFGSTVTATNTRSFQQFLVDRTDQGALTVRGPFGTDKGTSVAEGERICDELQSLGGRRSCGFVFRENADGDAAETPYVWVEDDGVFMISSRH